MPSKKKVGRSGNVGSTTALPALGSASSALATTRSAKLGIEAVIKPSALPDLAIAKPALNQSAMDIDSPLATPTTTRAVSIAPSQVEPDGWTEEQLTSLFAGIIKWKPTGMHKHFRVIAIHEHLRNHGYNVKDNPHTRIPGIWKKIREYYDTDILDAMAYARDPPPNEPGKKRVWLDFNLPYADYGDEIEKRATQRDPSEALSEAASSPPAFDPDAQTKMSEYEVQETEVDIARPKRKRSGRDSTVDDSDDSSAASSARKQRSVTSMSARAQRATKRIASRASLRKSTAKEEEEEGEDGEGQENDEDEEDEKREESDDNDQSKYVLRRRAAERADRNHGWSKSRARPSRQR